MRLSKLITLTCLVSLTLAWFYTGCGPKSKCLIIIENGKANFQGIMLGEQPKQGWLPGRVVLFRETIDLSSLNTQLPSGTIGKAGEVYRIDSQYKLEKIGEFDPKLPNSQLLTKYAEGCD